MAGKWFSAALNAARSLQQPKGKPDQMINTLRKQPGVKQEEMNFLSLDELFNGKDIVTAEELQRAIKARLSGTGMTVNESIGVHLPMGNPTQTVPGLQVNRRTASGDLETDQNTLFGAYSMASEDIGKISPGERLKSLKGHNYVERVPQAGHSDHAYDYHTSGDHFPHDLQPVVKGRPRLNIGHTRGFDGELVVPNTASDEVAPVFVLDEVQSDLMQDIHKKNRDLRQREENIASEVSQFDPDVSLALNERWKKDQVKDIEVQKVLDKLVENGTFEIVDQPGENVEIISAITGRSLGFGTQREAMEQAANFVEQAMLPQSKYSDDIVSLFVDGFKDPYPIEEIIGEMDYGSSPLQQIIDEQNFLAAGRKNLPYQKSWPELLLKDAMQEAVDRDAPYLAWLDGERQAGRYGPEDGVWEGLKSFYDRRLPNSKLFKGLGLDKPQRGRVMLKNDFFPRQDNSWIVKLPPEVKEQIRKNGLPLFSLGALATYGPYQNQGALYE